ncbi:rab effector MyRIP isoform X2 [Gambusia affinis]|uniref:rab effector MyRIP isoform X2 n=1 Tax=Gambusia affinis TaxID=33528 RepID=UPI001CDB4C48|nr:rab effector MyRIP isoform X2 [Gambusia affinis]
MGRKLDLTGLTDNEAEHVLQVVQRDMRLRKKEEERLSELKQELDEEGSRCLLLSRQACFNQRCCIRCCSPFTFLLNPKRQCRDCRYNVCKTCRVYSKRDKAWLCSACQKSRLLKTQSLEWFYTNVKKRFKRFGSAKVLKTLYRKHLAEHSALSELTDGSACDESICNETSVCGSDSTFYRQTEEHSVAETLSVALRVAEEAVDEAISKESQNEALYLREHRGELAEELAQTIVQNIISRKNASAEMRAEYAHGWVSEHNSDPHHRHSACDQPSGSLKQQANLWRSHSAFTLLDNNQPALKPDVPKALKKDDGASAMTAWKSVDRLDNSVLKSPDGNWIALQTTQLSRPGLLTRRKSLVYSALERESGVVSAYEGLGSDSESKSEPDNKMVNQDDFGDNIMTLTGRQGNKDDPFSDSEGNLKHSKPLIALLKRKMPAEFRKPSSRRTSIIDVDFNLKGAEREKDELKVSDEQEEGKIRRSRKKRRSKKEPAASSSPSDLNNKEPFYSQPSDAATPHTSAATTPEPFDPSSDAVNHTVNNFTSKPYPCPGTVYEFCPREEERDEEKYENNDGQQGERRQRSGSETDVNLGEGERTGEEKERDDGLQYRLCSLVSQASLTYLSSTEDESDGVGPSEGEWDSDADMDKGGKEQVQIERLTYRLCHLEKQVRATKFSSTEDELDRMGLEMENMEHEVGKDEDLAVRLCRLANKVNASQYSSTEDELDKAGRGEDGEDEADENELWSVQAERTQLRVLASLVSASQFSSTEDELDRLGDNEEKQEQEENRATRDMRELWEGEESIGDIDMEMFNLTDETEEREQERGERGKCQRKVEDDATRIQKDKRVAEERTVGMRQLYDKYMELFKEPAEWKEINLKTEMETEVLQEAKAEEEKEPPSKGTDVKGEQEFLKGSEESERKFETDSKSDEDEAEFDRIISSMLMMTLEDMQGEMMDKAGQTEQRKLDVERETERELSERKDATEETPERSDSVITLCISEETDGEISDKRQKGNNTGRDENIHEENRRDMTTVTELQTSKTKLTSPNSEEKSENQDGRRRNTAESEAAEMHRDNANCEQKDGDGQVKEEKKTEKMGQCSSCTHLGEFLSPEEIQNGRDMELYKTIELMSSVLEQQYSAASLRSITTEVLKVLNATEELLQGVEAQDKTQVSAISLPPNTDPKKLDQQFWKLEENVYVAAGSVYSLEAELSDLEECAREICSSTSNLELSFLEEQVAAAAAKVQQSELQISDISARIAALKSAGLNVDTQSRFTKTRAATEKSVTLDSSRHLRRRLPAPPVREDKEA